MIFGPRVEEWKRFVESCPPGVVEIDAAEYVDLMGAMGLGVWPGNPAQPFVFANRTVVVL